MSTPAPWSPHWHLVICALCRRGCQGGGGGGSARNTYRKQPGCLDLTTCFKNFLQSWLLQLSLLWLKSPKSLLHIYSFLGKIMIKLVEVLTKEKQIYTLVLGHLRIYMRWCEEGEGLKGTKGSFTVTPSHGATLLAVQGPVQPAASMSLRAQTHRLA